MFRIYNKKTTTKIINYKWIHKENIINKFKLVTEDVEYNEQTQKNVVVLNRIFKLVILQVNK